VKLKDFARVNNLDRVDFDPFIRQEYGFDSNRNIDDILIPDMDSRKVLDKFRSYKDDHAQEKIDKERALAQKKRALAQMLISSGFNFEGYRIVKYSGYISGDDAIEIPRGTASIFDTHTHVGDALMGSLTKIRRNALQELKEAAYDLGCNAIIGVDFDYITLDPETANMRGGTTYLPYVFGVTANGNAVIIEKIEDDE